MAHGKDNVDVRQCLLGEEISTTTMSFLKVEDNSQRTIDRPI